MNGLTFHDLLQMIWNAAATLIEGAHENERNWIVKYIVDCDPQDPEELAASLRAIAEDKHRPSTLDASKLN